MESHSKSVLSGSENEVLSQTGRCTREQQTPQRQRSRTSVDRISLATTEREPGSIRSDIPLLGICSEDVSLAKDTSYSQSTTLKSWLPFTLRWPFLVTLIVLELALGATVFALTGYSIRTYGLGSDDGTSLLFFGWRFSPTLIATTHALLVSALLSDVRRTDVFARLSRSRLICPDHTLCFPARSWWHDPFDALSKTKNGGSRSWSLLFASATYIFALGISPLSAGFLSPVIVRGPKPGSFTQAALPDNMTWELNSTDSVVFRTISGAILDKQTSLWLSTEYAILPFRLSGFPIDLSMEGKFNADPLPQQWAAKTLAYRVELDCTPIILIDTYNSTVYSTGYEGVVYNHTGILYEFASDDGCNIKMQDIFEATYTSPNWARFDAAWWEPASKPSSILSSYGSSNSSSECGNRTMLVVKASADVDAQLCSANFFMSNVTANLSITQSMNSVQIDNTEFINNRELMDPVHYDIYNLATAFQTFDWSTKFFSSGNNTFGGPLSALAAGTYYNNEPSKMLHRPYLLEQARRLYQQFLGEMLLLALNQDALQDQPQQPFFGAITSTERRIIVNTAIGKTLGVVLTLSGMFVAVVAFSTRLGRRELGIQHDPSQIAAVVHLPRDDKQIRRMLEGADRVAKEALAVRLRVLDPTMKAGALTVTDTGTGFSKQEDSRGVDPRPVVLRTWMAPLFAVFLCVTLTSIAVLYRFSSTSGIHQRFLTYQHHFSVFDAAATFTPYSILPTLLAVTIKLWFSAIGDALKRLQPYVSMLKAPTPLANSVLIEYANTPLALISSKAIRSSHLILAIVGVAAFASEAFTVGMSALWDLHDKPSIHSLILSRELELRSIPKVFKVESADLASPSFNDEFRTPITGNIYRASLQSWLYSAAIEVTQSATTPTWSKDAWSFLPLNMDTVEASIITLDIGNVKLPGQITNLTFRTPAIRARLECHHLDYSNTSLWTELVDFTNKTLWNSTNKPPGTDYGYVLTKFANRGSDIGSFTCCANETDGIPGDTAIGYWSDLDWSLSKFTSSMTALWIVGRPFDGGYKSVNFTIDPDHTYKPLFVWSEQPRMTAINCTPIYEQANSSLTVELGTGIVQSYEILDDPVPVATAWSDPYLRRNISIDYTEGYEDLPRGYYNVTPYVNATASWGYIFLDTLTNSGTSSSILAGNWQPESESMMDRVFNFKYAGLNADFMSYCMLQLAGNDKFALLDPDTLEGLASEVFGIFFKHFATENVSSTLGGQIYQPIGQRLPRNLGGATQTYGGALPEEQQAALVGQNNTPSMDRSVNAVLSVPTEQLVMSPIAVYLCISVLVILILTTILIFTANRPQLKALPRDTDTLASVLAFVYGSEKLRDWARDMPVSHPWYGSSKHRAQDSQLKARLGPFVDSAGRRRWGVELVDPEEAEEDREHNMTRGWIALQPQRPMLVESDDGEHGNIGVREEQAEHEEVENKHSEAETKSSFSDRLLDDQ